MLCGSKPHTSCVCDKTKENSPLCGRRCQGGITVIALPCSCASNVAATRNYLTFVEQWPCIVILKLCACLCPWPLWLPLYGMTFRLCTTAPWSPICCTKFELWPWLVFWPWPWYHMTLTLNEGWYGTYLNRQLCSVKTDDYRTTETWFRCKMFNSADISLRNWRCHSALHDYYFYIKTDKTELKLLLFIYGAFPESSLCGAVVGDLN